MSNDKQFTIRLDTTLAAHNREFKRLFGRTLLADQPSCDIFTAISRDFVMLVGAPLRALHLESRTEMDKASFVTWCRRYGELKLNFPVGSFAGSGAAGEYWWECQHYPEHRRVVTRASLTARSDLHRPKVEDQSDD